MNGNLFSLVLAAATGWAVLAIGFLPVTVLRQRRSEALKAAAAWAVVAATAPAAVYHWYLIFALICLVAWTKLDRPAGKVVLAIAAALGLSLGIVFPLEAVPGFLVQEPPLALASLYLGGAAAGLAYALFVVTRTPDSTGRPPGFARAVAIASFAWAALVGAALFRKHYPLPVPIPGTLPHLVLLPNAWVPLMPMIVMVMLGFSLLGAVRRPNLRAVRGLSVVTAVMALGTSLLMQFVVR